MKISKIKTVLVDDEPRALNRMKILLKNFNDIHVSESFEQADVGLEYILAYKPDLVFLDIEMPKRTGLEMSWEINKNSQDTKIIFTTSHEQYAIKAIKNEAFDYLLKPIGLDDLKETLDRYKAKIHSNLSKRENEIIRLIAQGFASKQIGEKLCISHHTVDTHRRKILSKTNCKNAAELTLFAVRYQLI